MTMQAATSLQHQINGSKVCDHQIEIKIQTLFNDLSSDEHEPIRSCHSLCRAFFNLDFIALLAEACERTFFPLVTISEQKARVKQVQFVFGKISLRSEEHTSELQSHS